MFCPKLFCSQWQTRLAGCNVTSASCGITSPVLDLLGSTLRSWTAISAVTVNLFLDQANVLVAPESK